MHIVTHSEAETLTLGNKIGLLLKKGYILALDGTLAAGKTYLTKGIAAGLDIKEEITSPTFAIISEYAGSLPLYHFDVYRLNSTDEFLDLGAEEFLYGNGVCIIEWAEKVKSELPLDTIFIKIEVKEKDERIFSIESSNKEFLTDLKTCLESPEKK